MRTPFPLAACRLQIGKCRIPENRRSANLISSGFDVSHLCLVLCGVFFVACYSCKMLGESDIFSPVLAAWMPVMLYGPFAVALFDAMHT